MEKIAVVALLVGMALPAVADDARMAGNAVPVAAEECTEEKAAELSNEIVAYLQENPAEAENIEDYMATIEKDYGGAPNEAQTCEALGRLLTMIRGTD